MKTTMRFLVLALSENIGKRVIVGMDAGENGEGTVHKVGDGLVPISKLPGRDFYDATVRIDRISAVIFKVRGNGSRLDRRPLRGNGTRGPAV